MALTFNSTVARAQGGSSGSVAGNVIDQTGMPIKGVKVAAKSDTQIGGAKVAYTNDEGYFHIPGLAPGTFEVIASAPKLKSLVTKNIKVGLTGATELNLVMEVETAVEEITIVERPPIVNTTAANVKEVYDEEFIDNLPLESRTSIEGIVASTTPGAYTAGEDEARFRGGATQQNAFNVEGFFMNGQKVTVKSLAAMEVQTAGYGAENAAVPGGVVNMVSKSGSNRYELDMSGTFDDSNLRFFTDANDVQSHSYNYFLNPAFSGPIIKDRLWFYANTELNSTIKAKQKDLTGLQFIGDPATQSNINTRGSLKLTWQVSPRNKLSNYTTGSRIWIRNQADATKYERDAQKKTDQFDFFTGLIWESVLGDSVFFRSQVGYQQFWSDIGPQRCLDEPIECDLEPQLRQTFPTTTFLNNYDNHTQEIRRSVEVINTFEWFGHSRRFGEHNVKAKSRIFEQMYESAESAPGNGFIQYNGTAYDRQRTYFSNDPRQEEPRYGWRIRGTSGLTTVHSLSDSIHLNRYFTLTPGIAFTTAKAANVGDVPNLDGTALTPHIQVTWDATQDGRTVLRASFNNYADTDALRLARFVLGARVDQECQWDPAGGPNGTGAFSSKCRYAGGADARTFGLPCGPEGVNPDGTSCRNKIKVPRTWEYTLGVERELVQGVGLGADLVYRLYTNPYEIFETNRIWNNSGTDLAPESMGQFRNGVNQQVTDLETPDAARRRYLGITTALHKREGNFKVTSAYTWARLEGNVDNNEDNAYGTNPTQTRYYLYGPLPDDARHTIKSAFTYQMTKWLSLGLVHRYFSGRPYQRKFRAEVGSSTPTDYRASVGTNPGANINDPGDDRPSRLPDLQEMNVQARVNLRSLINVNMEAYVDVLNVLALRTTKSVIEQDGPAWGLPDARQDPFHIRLGFRYRY